MQRVFRHARSLVPHAALAAAMLAAGPRLADAQSAIYGAGLQAWLGCWAAEPAAARVEAPPPIVCIVPATTHQVADVLTIQDGTIVARATLDASGRSRAIDADRCTGVRSSTWSRDGRRLFVRSTGACAGVPSATSGIMSITPDGDWLDVESLSAGGATSVRVARYRAVPPPAALPAAMRSVLGAQSLATRSVRVASTVPVRAEDVLEAARVVDSAAIEAWILERAQRFEVSASELDALVAAGLPVRVADALAAIAEPQSYALDRVTDAPIAALPTRAYDDGFGLPLGWGWGWGTYLLGTTRYGQRRDAWRYGHYRPPVIVVRGRDGRPRGGWKEGRGGSRPGDGGRDGRDGRDGRGTGAQRPRDERPPAGDPRHAPTGDPRRAPAQSGGTVRLGTPRG